MRSGGFACISVNKAFFISLCAAVMGPVTPLAILSASLFILLPYCFCCDGGRSAVALLPMVEEKSPPAYHSIGRSATGVALGSSAMVRALCYFVSLQ